MYNTNIKMNTKNKQLIVRLTDELKSKYDEYCLKNGFSPSKRTRILIQKDIDNKLIIKD